MLLTPLPPCVRMCPLMTNPPPPSGADVLYGWPPIHWGGGSNNKKDRAAGKNLRCPLSFLFFFKTRSKSTFLCRIWSKMCPQKRTKKIMIFVFFDLLCSFLLFLPDLVNKMSSNREQKRTKKIMPPGKSQDVLCLFCCWTPPPHSLQL